MFKKKKEEPTTELPTIEADTKLEQEQKQDDDKLIVGDLNKFELITIQNQERIIGLLTEILKKQE